MNGERFFNHAHENFSHDSAAPPQDASHTSEGMFMSAFRNKIRFALVGLLVAAGLAFGPAAFARGHVSIGIGLPGISLGYSDYRHGWGGGYYGYVAPAYAYAPAYYGPAYYGPSYYSSYPAYYGGAVYYGGSYGRNYYRGGYYDRGYRGRDYRGHDYGHRGNYYDRGGGYRHR